MSNTELDIVAIRDVETPTIDAAAFDRLDTMPEGFNATAEYLKFDKPGDARRVFWTGWTTMPSKQADAATGKPKEIDAGVFLWRESPNSGPKRVIHAGSNLVLQLKSIGHHGAPVPLQITFKGKQKANTGNSFDAFDVVVLNGNAPRTEQQPVVQDNKQIAASALKWIENNRQAITIKQARQTNARAVQLATDAGLPQSFIDLHASPADEMSGPAMVKHAEDLFNAVVSGKTA